MSAISLGLPIAYISKLLDYVRKHERKTTNVGDMSVGNTYVGFLYCRR